MRQDRSSTVSKGIATAATALVCGLVAAPPALSSAVSYDPVTEDSSFTAGPGEQNSLHVTFETIDHDQDNSTPEVDVIRYSDYQSTITFTDNVYCLGDDHNVYCSRTPGQDSLATINLGDGNDELREATPGRDAVNGGPGDDKLHGGGGNDVVDGGDGNDTIRETIGSSIGTTGDGAGRDTITGGPGVDLIRVSGYGSTVVHSVTLNGVADDGVAGEGDNVAGDVENVQADGPTRFVGNDSPNVFNGSGAVDEADGGGGDDELYGGLGNDTLNGGPGNDIVQGYGDGDTIDGGTGSDDLSGEGGSTISDGTGGADVIIARDGILDTVACGSGADRAVVDQLDVIADAGRDFCESIDRQVIETPPPPPPPPLPPEGSVATVALTAKSAKVKKGAFPLRLTCGGSVDCAGTISVKSGKRAIGSARFSIRAGKAKSVKVKLNGAGRKLIRRRKSSKVTVSLKLAGQKAKTIKLKLTR